MTAGPDRILVQNRIDFVTGAVRRYLPDAEAPAEIAAEVRALVAGRAAIHSPAPLRAGCLVKVAVEAGRAARVPLYGKVVRSPRRPGGGLMQVQLTQLSQRQLRGLYGLVDEFRAALAAAGGGPAPSR